MIQMQSYRHLGVPRAGFDHLSKDVQRTDGVHCRIQHHNDGLFCALSALNDGVDGVQVERVKGVYGGIAGVRQLQNITNFFKSHVYPPLQTQNSGESGVSY